jgi:hypothetical protein
MGTGRGPRRVMTPRFIISAFTLAANRRSLAKLFGSARSATNSTAASSPFPARISPAFG